MGGLMKLEEGQLRVYYGGPLDRDLDIDIEECLKRYGFCRWASGYNLEEGVRDLAFEVKK